MIILTNRAQVADLTDSHLQQLVEQRIQGIEECCPWDVNELGPIIIVEPGDSAEQLEAVMGFSILEGLLDGTRFGDSDFSPAFEFAELHGDHLFEVVYIVSDSGYGYDIFIVNQPGIDPTLLAFCQSYAVVAA